jgi:hypothetical protein
VHGLQAFRRTRRGRRLASRCIVENDRYPFSPRIRKLRAILAKLRPEPVRAAEGVCAAVERQIPAARLD